MVGIHARTGREKIFARNVAHVLNDETQRKYIQVCITFFLFKCKNDGLRTVVRQKGYNSAFDVKVGLCQ